MKLRTCSIVLCFTLSIMFLTGCTISTDGNDFKISAGADEKEHSTDEIVMDDVAVKGADIEVNVGTVTVGYSDSSSAEIGIDYTVTGDDEDVLKEILELVKVKAEIQEDEIKISVVNKETNGNMWSWIEREYKSFNNKPNLDVDLDILLPADTREFDITCNVGDINLHSLKGEFSVSSNVGSIEMKDISFEGDSDITADVGNVTCKLNKDMKDASEVTLTTNIGDIKLDTDNLTYTTENENDDNFLGDSKRLMVNELCEIDINVSLGNFTLR